jgi:calcineurin-like phosphoesterase family protein
MNVIYATEQYPVTHANSIFLAGPTPRNQSVPSWRNEAIDILKEMGFDGDVYIPEPRNGQFLHSYDSQIEWELEGLNRANIIVFWVPRELTHMPAFTTNVEFGAWYMSGKMVFGSPNDAEKMNYLIYVAKREGSLHHSTLKDTLAEAAQRLKTQHNPATPRVWFISDTHFGSERTLKLSRRPFKNVIEMDRAMISNWNQLVGIYDTVYHLGDFGDYEVAKHLNGNIVLLLGNYERDDIEKGIVTLDDFTGRFGFASVKEDPFVLEDPSALRLVHEPSHAVGDIFHLYGHIHRAGMVKKHMLNVGVDCNFFKPFSVDDVHHFMNAVELHYDHEVF